MQTLNTYLVQGVSSTVVKCELRLLLSITKQVFPSGGRVPLNHSGRLIFLFVA